MNSVKIILTCERMEKVGQMREIIHIGYDGKPIVPTNMEPDDCFFNNLDAPVVRTGTEAFKSYYDIECFTCYSAIDPSRSLVETVVKGMDERSSESNNWPASDALYYLLRDLGIWNERPTVADNVAFWTMFPAGTAEFLSQYYMKVTRFLNRHGDYIRVINNPLFYHDPNAPTRRLVELAEVNGFHYALDRACVIPAPDVLAKELAILNYGYNEPTKVPTVAEALTASIAETMDDWGLMPQTKAGEA